jgi:hypothetical protein
MEDDFRRVIALVDEAVHLAHEVQAKTSKLKEFQVRLTCSAFRSSGSSTD